MSVALKEVMSFSCFFVCLFVCLYGFFCFFGGGISLLIRFDLF